jgi:hypothetical protein
VNADIDNQDSPNRLLRMEADHMRLFRWGMLLLVYFAVAFSGLAWERIHDLGIGFDAAPVGASILIVLFVAYVFQQAQSLSHLRSDGKHEQPTGDALQSSEQAD